MELKLRGWTGVGAGVRGERERGVREREETENPLNCRKEGTEARLVK